MIKNLIKNAPATLITLSMIKHFCRNCSFILQRFAMMEPARKRAEICSGFSKASEIDQKGTLTLLPTVELKAGRWLRGKSVSDKPTRVSDSVFSGFVKVDQNTNYILVEGFGPIGQLWIILGQIDHSVIWVLFSELGQCTNRASQKGRNGPKQPRWSWVAQNGWVSWLDRWEAWRRRLLSV